MHVINSAYLAGVVDLDSIVYGAYGNGRPKPEKLKLYHDNLYIYNKSLNSKNSGDRAKCIK